MVLQSGYTFESPGELLKNISATEPQTRGYNELVCMKDEMVMKDLLLNGTHKQPPTPCMHLSPFPGAHQAYGRSHGKSTERIQKLNRQEK